MQRCPSVPDGDRALAPLPLALASVGFLAGAGLSWGTAGSTRRPPRQAPTSSFVLFLLPSPHFFATAFPRALDNASYVHELLSGVRNVWAVLRERVLGFADWTTV